MKPANFPERRRQRRLRALDRLTKQQATPERLELIARLHELTAAPARGVRTKKNRAATARMSRP